MIPENPLQAPHANYAGYANPFMMAPMPPAFYYPGQSIPGHGYQFPQFSPPANAAAPMTNQVAKAPDTVEYPDVVHWFRFLDGHEVRRKDGIEFSPYGVLLKSKGFLRITQLTLDFFTLKDLQEWLSIEIGTAVLIMQYAKEDIDAIKAGHLVIPNE
jgi:hypothetical protein